MPLNYNTSVECCSVCVCVPKARFRWLSPLTLMLFRLSSVSLASLFCSFSRLESTSVVFGSSVFTSLNASCLAMPVKKSQ